MNKKQAIGISVIGALALVILLLTVTGVRAGPDATLPVAPAIPATQAAIVSPTISYQGRLLDGEDNPVDGTTVMTFSLYAEATGGSSLWQDRLNVPVNEGLFDVTLAVDPGLFDGQALWLGVRVGGDAQELQPRRQLLPVPYAFHALTARWSGLMDVPPGFADGVDNDTIYFPGPGLTLNGTDFAITTTYRLPQGCGDGQIAEWDATGKMWYCGSDDVGGGGAAWLLGGNAGTSYDVDFLGTTDAVSLTLVAGGSVALRLEPTGGTPNLLGGIDANWTTAGVSGATIGGGGSGTVGANQVTDDYGAVGGGAANRAGDADSSTTDATYATVGGGYLNAAAANQATVGGGGNNHASGRDSTVGGGEDNYATGGAATVAGGTNHFASGEVATVGGGKDNIASGYGAAVGGGITNTATFTGTTIGGGASNVISATHGTIAGGRDGTVTGDYASIGGGWDNTASGNLATVGGGDSNIASGEHATIGGGGDNVGMATYGTIAGGYDSVVTGDYAAVGGGYRNTTSGTEATIGGGYYNTASGLYATIGGGYNNEITATSAAIGGGYYNTATGADAAIGGGYHNTASGLRTTVGGGDGNTASGDYATIGGGDGNTASGDYTTVGGGYSNESTTIDATIGGGNNNSASGVAATVPGGDSNAASGAYSFAAGGQAHATHPGSFVWSSAESAASWGDNTFTARAHGGARFYSASGTGTGVQLSSGGTSWASISDRNAKENFSAVDIEQVLETLASMPIQTWNLKTQSPNLRHVGPVAQDFNGEFAYLFGEVESPVHINNMDAVGISLAAAQGLYARSQEQATRIAEMETENAALQQQVDDLEVRLAALEQRAEFIEGTAVDGTSPARSLQSNLLPDAGIVLVGLVGLAWLRRKSTARSLPKGGAR